MIRLLVSGMRMLATVGAGMAASTAWASEGPQGLWVTPAGHEVLVYNCNPGLCARLARVSPDLVARAQAAGSGRGQIKVPAIGTPIFQHLPEDGANRWAGLIYYPEGRQSFSGSLRYQADGTLRLEGRSDSATRTRIWRRRMCEAMPQ